MTRLGGIERIGAPLGFALALVLGPSGASAGPILADIFPPPCQRPESDARRSDGGSEVARPASDRSSRERMREQDGDDCQKRERDRLYLEQHSARTDLASSEDESEQELRERFLAAQRRDEQTWEVIDEALRRGQKPQTAPTPAVPTLRPTPVSFSLRLLGSPEIIWSDLLRTLARFR